MEDTARLCELVYRNLGRITQAFATLDTHSAAQVFHPLFWVDARGAHPDPYSTILLEDCCSPVVVPGVVDCTPAADEPSPASPRPESTWSAPRTRWSAGRASPAETPPLPPSGGEGAVTPRPLTLSLSPQAGRGERGRLAAREIRR